jgi:hypothetical protein
MEHRLSIGIESLDRQLYIFTVRIIVNEVLYKNGWFYHLTEGILTFLQLGSRDLL